MTYTLPTITDSTQYTLLKESYDELVKQWNKTEAEFSTKSDDNNASTIRIANLEDEVKKLRAENEKLHAGNENGSLEPDNSTESSENDAQEEDLRDLIPARSAQQLHPSTLIPTSSTPSPPAPTHNIDSDPPTRLHTETLNLRTQTTGLRTLNANFVSENANPHALLSAHEIDSQAMEQSHAKAIDMIVNTNSHVNEKKETLLRENEELRRAMREQEEVAEATIQSLRDELERVRRGDGCESENGEEGLYDDDAGKITYLYQCFESECHCVAGMFLETYREGAESNMQILTCVS
jgi:septal ring factor EnvC (AmiA/AmiB activator)